MRLVVKCDLSAQFNGQSGTSRESSKQGMAVPKEIVYMGKLATFNQVWVFFFFIDCVAELLSLLMPDVTMIV